MSDQTVHASAVALNGVAVLIQGASGSGKSTLALDLMARGGILIADDRVVITATDGGPLLSCPEPLRGLIEARGVGVLKVAAATAPIPLRLVVQITGHPLPRMPDETKTNVAGYEIDLISTHHGRDAASMVMLLLSEQAQLFEA